MESTSLRQEQDREYLESQRQDRLRREQREKEEEELRRRQATEAAAHAESVAAEQLAQARASNILQAKRDNLALKPEPAIGSSTDVTTLRLQMPSGQKLQRRFLKKDTVQHLREWLDVHLADSADTDTDTHTNTDTATPANHCTNYSLSTAYPKTELADPSATLESYGLHPRGMLYVVDLDL